MQILVWLFWKASLRVAERMCNYPGSIAVQLYLIALYVL
jgi:hypothetical protein